MQIYVHRSNKNCVRIFRIILSDLYRSAAAYTPNTPPQHTRNNQEVPINVVLRQAIVKMTIIDYN